MSEARRNTAVGLFVIVGFVLLGAIIVQFSNLASLAGGGYRIKVNLDHSGNIMSGKIVHFNGVPIGTVKSVTVAEGGQGVVIVLRINEGVVIPEHAQLRSQSSGLGDTYLDFVLPRDDQGRWIDPGPPLATDGLATITGTTATGSSLLPQNLTSKAEAALAKFEQLDVERLDAAIRNFADMTEARSLADVDAGKVKPNLTTAIARFDAAVAKMADDENAKSLKELLKNVSTAAGTFGETMKQAKELIAQMSVATGKLSSDADVIKDKADKLLTKLMDDAMRVSDLLTTLNSLAKGVQEGEGTVGKLLKSEDLHKQIVMMMLDMQEAAKALNRLLVKLEKEGLMRKGG